MAVHPLAGKTAPADILIDPARLERDYYERRPDLANLNHLVAFGTSLTHSFVTMPNVPSCPHTNPGKSNGRRVATSI